MATVHAWSTESHDGSYLAAVTMRDKHGHLHGDVARARNKTHLVRLLAKMRAQVLYEVQQANAKVQA